MSRMLCANCEAEVNPVFHEDGRDWTVRCEACGWSTVGGCGGCRRLRRERDLYREALEHMAHDGCGMHGHHGDRTCRSVEPDGQPNWCWSCLATEILESVANEAGRGSK